MPTPMKEYRAKRPWYKHYASTKQRCNDKNYHKYKNYGARGIRLIMTSNDFKELWFRDEAYKMNRPSIDRIDNDGHYEKDNCRFLELGENAKKRWDEFRAEKKFRGLM